MQWTKSKKTGPRVGLLRGATLIGLMLAAQTVMASPYPLDQIMDQPMADKLIAQKITTTTQLLEQGAKPKQRKDLAQKSGLALAKIHGWVKMCDLLRIKEVGPEMVRLLEAGKITTVSQLKVQKAAILHPRLIQANKKTKLTDNPPVLQQVQAWIDQAKKLAPVLR